MECTYWGFQQQARAVSRHHRHYFPERLLGHKHGLKKNYLDFRPSPSYVDVECGSNQKHSNRKYFYQLCEGYSLQLVTYFGDNKPEKKLTFAHFSLFKTTRFKLKLKFKQGSTNPLGKVLNLGDDKLELHYRLQQWVQWQWPLSVFGPHRDFDGT